MKRRSFLKYTSLATAGAMFPFRGFSINPNPQLPFLAALAAGGNPQGRVLVLIYLNGGNDGINTLLPLDQYDNLQDVRQNILPAESAFLTLDGAPVNRLHPSMTHLRSLFNEGKVNIVQNVGYPDQDYSHFRSTDIWMTASDSDEHLETGWLARYLQGEYPGFPTGYPNADMPDPLAIEIGSVSSLSLMGTTQPMGMAVTDPTSFYQFVNDLVEPAPDTPYGDELEFIRLISQQAQVYYQAVKNAADAGQNLSNLYPAPGVNPLADELKIVAQLISGGLQTPIYLVSLGGFDTHSEQVDLAAGPLQGNHARLLGWLSQAIGAFQDDLELLGVDDRVAGMTFSEFGRTIASNASYGTDHGAAAPLFVFGSKVIPGIIGTNPVIPNNVFGSPDIPMQHDFRSIYASALQDWFGLANPETVLEEPYPILPIFQASVSTHTAATPVHLEVSNAPNPFRTTTTIRVNSGGGRVQISLLDINGRILRILKEGMHPEGVFEVVLERGDLPAGAYFYQVQVNRTVVTKNLMVL